MNNNNGYYFNPNPLQQFEEESSFIIDRDYYIGTESIVEFKRKVRPILITYLNDRDTLFQRNEEIKELYNQMFPRNKPQNYYINKLSLRIRNPEFDEMIMHIAKKAKQSQNKNRTPLQRDCIKLYDQRVQLSNYALDVAKSIRENAERKSYIIARGNPNNARKVLMRNRYR